MNNNYHKQQGVSLLIALIMLLVMSMLGVSAVRMSSQDLMVASNEQQHMLVHQAAESTQQEVVEFYNLFVWLEDGTIPTSRNQQLEHGNITTDISLSQGIDYPCLGQSGAANSQGVGVSRCRAYNFEILSRLDGTGAVAKRFKTEGKQLPNPKGN